MRYEVRTEPAAASTPFPDRTDVQWERTDLQVRNAGGFVEQQELVYELSWIEELGTWRRFLTSRRTVRSERQGVPC
jgi:hypothetical protein